MNKRLVSKKSLFIIAILVLAIAVVGVVFWQYRYNPVPQLVYTATQTAHEESFPQIDTSTLDDRQRKIISLLRQEHTAQHPGTKYSEGINEPWCADFVSWIMREAGQPLTNPNSGLWRIPGTYTLRDYYNSVDKFEPAGSSYQPKVGDIMLYDNPSPFGQHTNIVIKNDHGVIITVGGNEMGKIRVVTHKTADKQGFVGYGIL